MRVIELDIDAIEQIALDDDGVNVAIECATEAAYAGMDNQEQLLGAVKAYLWHQKVFGAPELPVGSTVPVPTSYEQAKMMLTLGYAYIREKHPEEEI